MTASTDGASEIDWRQLRSDEAGPRIRSVRFLGEGWTSRAYLVNGEVVFRFPKRSEVWEELEREVAFLTEAADALPLDVPRYLIIARASPAAAHGYAAYSYLPGHAITLSELSDRERSAAADAIAGFLQALHRYQPSASVTARLTHDDGRARAVELLQRAEHAVVPRLSKEEATRLRQQFSWYVGTPANFSCRPVVIHADLSREHILAIQGRVAGVIDFSDVSFGDPDYDFASLYVDFGEDFALDVAQRCAHPDVHLLPEKLRYFDLADRIDTIVNGDGWALEGQAEEAWRGLRRSLSQRAEREDADRNLL